MESIMQYIFDLFIGEGIIIAVGAFVTGMIIKNSLDFINNKYIPLIGGIFGSVIGVMIPQVFSDADIVTSLIKGLAIGWAATGGYETIKNLIENRRQDI